jgi:hypothetical protein
MHVFTERSEAIWKAHRVGEHRAISVAATRLPAVVEIHVLVTHRAQAALDERVGVGHEPRLVELGRALEGVPAVPAHRW